MGVKYAPVDPTEDRILRGIDAGLALGSEEIAFHEARRSSHPLALHFAARGVERLLAEEEAAPFDVLLGADGFRRGPTDLVVLPRADGAPAHLFEFRVATPDTAHEVAAALREDIASFGERLEGSHAFVAAFFIVLSRAPGWSKRLARGHDFAKARHEFEGLITATVDRAPPHRGKAIRLAAKGVDGVAQVVAWRVAPRVALAPAGLGPS